MSCNLWNIKDLEAPPITTCRINDKKLDLRELKTLLNEAVETFTNQKTIETEAALLSRTIYRMKSKLRKDKGFKQFEKVKRALLQFLGVKHFRVLEVFVSVLPDNYEDFTYLPSLNMLDYVLVRTQGVTKLLARIVECALETGFYLQRRLHIGDFWNVAFFAFAIVSRIFTATKHLVKVSCKFFNELSSLREYFENTANSWLPRDYEYPKNLNAWLDVDWMNEKVEMQPIAHKFLRFDYYDDSDVEYFGEYMDLTEEPEITDEYIQVLSDEEKMYVKKKKTKHSSDVLEIQARDKIEDLGEIFQENNLNTNDSSRSLKPVNKIKPKGSKKKFDIRSFINTLNHIDDIRDFINEEKSMRKLQLKNSKFKHLSKPEWIVLYGRIDKQLESLKNVKKGNKIKKCVEKIKQDLISNLNKI